MIGLYTLFYECLIQMYFSREIFWHRVLITETMHQKKKKNLLPFCLIEEYHEIAKQSFKALIQFARNPL